MHVLTDKSPRRAVVKVKLIRLAVKIFVSSKQLSLGLDEPGSHKHNIDNRNREVVHQAEGLHGHCATASVAANCRPEFLGKPGLLKTKSWHVHRAQSGGEV